MTNSEEMIIKGAIKCVSEYGLSKTRTQIIAEKSGLSEAMIYKLFGSKDTLLRICFETVDKRIAALFNGMQISEEQIKKNPEEVVFILWSTYFKWLISHKEETLFYFAYRMAAFFPQYERTREAPWFGDFVAIFSIFDKEYELYKKISPSVLWTHILTVTQLYAKLAIEGSVPSDDAAIQSIFKMLMSGLGGFFKP